MSSWKAGYVQDPLPQIDPHDVEMPTQPVRAVTPAMLAERDTEGIDERALNQALKAQQQLAIARGRPLDVPQDQLVPGKLGIHKGLAPWYWDTHREMPHGQRTTEHRAMRNPQGGQG